MHHNFFQLRDSINPLSHLMQIRFTTLPWLQEQITSIEPKTKARQQALERLEQMPELFDFFVGTIEVSPRHAAHLLDLRIMPRKRYKSDNCSLRWFYQGRSSALALTNLLEELRLYCTSRWCFSIPLAKVHVERIDLLWRYFLHSQLPETMLYRLPSALRDEIAFLRS